MRIATVTSLISLIAASASSIDARAAGRFSWFDEQPSAERELGLGQALLPARDTHVSFGVDAYKSFKSLKSLTPASGIYEDSADFTAQREGDVVRLYGEHRKPQSDFYTPLAVINRGSEQAPWGDLGRLSGFGLKWNHRLDAENSVAVTAGYSEMPSLYITPGREPQTYDARDNLARTRDTLDMVDTRAALSFTSRWTGALRPGLTGAVFLGDETARDETYQHLGRKYYGFSLGGQLTLSQDHTPYVAYQLRRNLYNPDDPAYLLSRYEDHSSLSAGWKWQVQQNWSFHAEASYGLNGAAVDLYSPDRSRVFFGTRFDFR